MYAIPKWNLIKKTIIPGLLASVGWIPVQSQCITQQQAWQNILDIENKPDTYELKTYQAKALMQKYESCQLPADSVFAGIVHRTGQLIYLSNGERADATSITLTRKAIQINSSGKKNACPAYVCRSYNNLGIQHLSLNMYKDALQYLDSAILMANKYPGNDVTIIIARMTKSTAYYRMEDMQKAIDEAILGLRLAEKNKDTIYLQKMHTVLAFALLGIGNNKEALFHVQQSEVLYNTTGRNDYLADALQVKSKIEIYEKRYANLQATQKKAIEIYTAENNTLKLSEYYTDMALTYSQQLRQFDKAGQYINQARQFAKATNDLSNLARVLFVNSTVLGEQKKNQEGLAQLQQVLLLVTPDFKNNNIFSNPYLRQLRAYARKQFLFYVLHNKAEQSLLLYSSSHKKEYMQLALQTCLLADSLLTYIRYEQTGESTKLFWRKSTRDFFDNALNASFETGNAPLAFYFMEKSRAVLLNDRLNELGANANLPSAERTKEQLIKSRMIELQLQLAELPDSSSRYKNTQQQMLLAQESWDKFISGLEQRFPAYYQYKYADNVPALNDLQAALKKGNHSFMHYYVGDTVVYMMAITPQGTQMVKKKLVNYDSKLNEFLAYCAGKQLLNTNYAGFKHLAFEIYNDIFQPLNVPAGRVIISADNAIIPFDALVSDTAAPAFLLQKYLFSYAYSARFLMNDFHKKAHVGLNFLGMAPVQFNPVLQLAPLISSKSALQNISPLYTSSHTDFNVEATRQNLLTQMGQYSVVNLYTHARADSSTDQPVLYMQDSAIYLSELQMLQNPATQLVVLSACQTSTGRLAAGEGIYSIARGFAAAGIPSAVATLWKADEKTVYEITELFHKNLTKGMPKDSALWLAKISWLQQAGKEHSLPYYWANLVLMGSNEPIALGEPKPKYTMYWSAGILLLALLVGWQFYRHKKRTSGKDS